MTQAEKKGLGEGGGLAHFLQADLARFDGLLAELRREHEVVARQLCDSRPLQAQGAADAGLRVAGKADAAPSELEPALQVQSISSLLAPRRASRVEAQGELQGAKDPPGLVPRRSLSLEAWPSAPAGFERDEAEAQPFPSNGRARTESYEPAWGGSPRTAHGVGVVVRDPTLSASSSAFRDAAASAASSHSGSIRKQKSFNKSAGVSLSRSLQTARQSLKALVTATPEVFDNNESDSIQRSFCYLFVSSPTFELFWSAVILLNTLTMALEAQYDGIESSFRHNLGRSPSTEPASEVWPGADTFFFVSDLMFGVLFTFELIWRIAVLRKDVFTDAWSWIDISAVAFWCIEKVSESVLPLEPKFIRVARLTKLLRFIRIIKFINAFEKLYLIVASLKSSFSALAWSSGVLFLFEMVFALLLNILMESFWDNTNNPIEDRETIYQHFGTFSKSLLSMFEMLLGNWYTITRELVKVNEWYMILGVGHQLMFGFAVIEVMTGVFLHETFQVASLDDGIMTNETKRAIKSNTEKMKIFFENADVNGDGYLDRHELEQVLQREKVREWLSGMGLDITNVITAFAVMDKDGDGQLSAEEFVEGALFLKGQARAIELAVLRSLLEEIKAKVGAVGEAQQSSSSEASVTIVQAQTQPK